MCVHMCVFYICEMCVHTCVFICMCMCGFICKGMCVSLFVTPQTVAHQGLLSMESTGVDCNLLLQGIFLTQGLILGLLHCRQILYHLSYWEAHEYWSG